MSKLTLEIPSDLAEALRLPPDERLARIQRELAVRLYQKGLLSFGKARELADMTKWDFHLLLGQEGIERSYDEEELDADLKTLESLG
jgi:predicted HTH domain antitoxin